MQQISGASWRAIISELETSRVSDHAALKQAKSFENIFLAADRLLPESDRFQSIDDISRVYMSPPGYSIRKPVSIAEISSEGLSRNLVAQAFVMPWSSDGKILGCVCMSTSCSRAVVAVEPFAITVLARLPDRETVVSFNMNHEMKSNPRLRSATLCRVGMDGTNFELAYVGRRRPTAILIREANSPFHLTLELSETGSFLDLCHILRHVLRGKLRLGRLLDEPLRMLGDGTFDNKLFQIAFLSLAVVMRSYIWISESSN